jgi:group I intron endonuclease
MKQYIIYRMNFPNGKCYIGYNSTALWQRQSEHKSRMKDPKYKHLPLYCALRKYGIENVTWDILSTHETTEEAQQEEIKQIKLVEGNSYNVAPGGLVNIITDEGRKKISESQIGKVYSEETKQRISEGLREHYSKPENKKLKSDRTKKLHQNPEYRKHWLKSRENFNSWNDERRDKVKQFQEECIEKILEVYTPKDTLVNLAQKSGVNYSTIRNLQKLWKARLPLDKSQDSI